MKPLTIVFSFNDKYWVQLATTISSLLSNRVNNTPYNIVILHRNFSSYIIEQLHKLLHDHTNIKLFFHEMPSLLIKHGFIDNHDDYISSDTYSRLFIPVLIENILKQKIDQVLYLGTDLIVCDDLGELRILPFRDHLFGRIKNQYIWNTCHYYTEDDHQELINYLK